MVFLGEGERRKGADGRASGSQGGLMGDKTVCDSVCVGVVPTSGLGDESQSSAVVAGRRFRTTEFF